MAAATSIAAACHRRRPRRPRRCDSGRIALFLASLSLVVCALLQPEALALSPSLHHHHPANNARRHPSSRRLLPVLHSQRYDGGASFGSSSSFGRFEKNERNPFGRNNGGGNNDGDDEEEDEAYRLVRDLAARRGINVQPSMGRRSAGESGVRRPSEPERGPPSSAGYGRGENDGAWGRGPPSEPRDNDGDEDEWKKIQLKKAAYERADVNAGRYDDTRAPPRSSSSSSRTTGAIDDKDNLFRRNQAGKSMGAPPPPSAEPQRLSQQNWLRKEEREVPPSAYRETPTTNRNQRGYSARSTDDGRGRNDRKNPQQPASSIPVARPPPGGVGGYGRGIYDRERRAASPIPIAPPPPQSNMDDRELRGPQYPTRPQMGQPNQGPPPQQPIQRSEPPPPIRWSGPPPPVRPGPVRTPPPDRNPGRNAYQNNMQPPPPNLGRNAYQNMPVRPLSAPLSELAARNEQLRKQQGGGPAAPPPAYQQGQSRPPQPPATDQPRGGRAMPPPPAYQNGPKPRSSSNTPERPGEGPRSVVGQANKYPWQQGSAPPPPPDNNYQSSQLRQQGGQAVTPPPAYRPPPQQGQVARPLPPADQLRQPRIQSMPPPPAYQSGPKPGPSAGERPGKWQPAGGADKPPGQGASSNNYQPQGSQQGSYQPSFQQRSTSEQQQSRGQSPHQGSYQPGFQQQSAPGQQQPPGQSYEPPPIRPRAPMSLSQLAAKPQLEPLDRPYTPNTGNNPRQPSQSQSPSLESQPHKFTQMDASDFRAPYNAKARQSPTSSQNAQNSFGSVVEDYPNNKRQSPQQPFSMGRQQGTSTSSFKPPSFQSVPQADFRQPYRAGGAPGGGGLGERGFPGAGSGFSTSGGARGEPSENFQRGGPPPPGSFEGSPPPGWEGPPPGSFENGPPPPGWEDAMEAMEMSPFAVPPMMFSGPPGEGMPPGPAGGRGRPPTRKEEEGVKVPKDPNVERQKKKYREVQSNFGNGRQDVKVPKDPFLERRKRAGQESQGRRPGPPSPDMRGSSNDEVRLPRDPFSERQQTQQGQEERRPYDPSQNAPWRSTMQSQSRGSDPNVGNMPTDPFGGAQMQGGSFADERQAKSAGYNPNRRDDDPFVDERPRDPRPRTEYGPQTTYGQGQNDATTVQRYGPQTTTYGQLQNDAAAAQQPPPNRRIEDSLSFGSRSGEDMTYEEYNSYFNDGPEGN